MNTYEFVSKLAANNGLTKKVNTQVLKSFLEVMAEELEKGERVVFTDFGVFETKVRKGREVKDPRNGDPIIVPDKTTIKFKPGKALKTLVCKEVKE